MITRRLVIDIGTNSVLALLADVSGNKLTVISDRKKTTRLGEGLSVSGILSPEAMRRTAEAIIEFVKSVEYDDLFMIGTEALRLAGNSSEFIKMIRESIGKEPVIVSGIKEAELSFLGALHNLDIKSENILLIDLGGGSTELVTVRREAILSAISIPIGALKLKETNIINLEGFKDEARRIIESKIGAIKNHPSAAIIATGGTITSVAAIKVGHNHFDAREIHGTSITIEEMHEIAIKFERTDSAGRANLIPFDPERSELILPGLGIFLAIMGIIGREALTVSTGGIRFGAALHPDKILP